jgi:uncharacterized protein YprB with RNaseH-like and TPR domain
MFPRNYFVRMRNLYLDAEWFPNQKIFLIGYAREDGHVTQLYSRSLTGGAMKKVLDRTRGHVYFYGPDIALIENHFQIDIRNHYDCVNLLRITRAFMPNARSWKLEHMEKVFRLRRSVAKYKKSIFQIYDDWKDYKYRQRVLLYNREDVANLVIIKKKMFDKHSITRDYLNTILLK